jgi:4,5-DOPA dioxygenase extradiol
MSLALSPNRTIMYLAILLVSFCVPLLYQPTATKPAIAQASAPTAPNMSDTTTTTPSSRMPVYFLSIGGPNFIENTQHPAYSKLGEVGREITTKVKPKAIVVFSAHWQDSPTRIQINAAEDTDIIYDFFGFPPHYYKYQFPNKGSSELADRVIDKLGGVGIEVQKVKRGLDHGVWAGFVVGTTASISYAF